MHDKTPQTEILRRDAKHILKDRRRERKDALEPTGTTWKEPSFEFCSFLITKSYIDRLLSFLPDVHIH
jgi:hypothetical protein